MSDLISRQDALDAVKSEIRYGAYVDHCGLDTAYDIIENLPSAEPEPEEFEWCHDCKEYDQEKHCCHRWTKVIRQTVEDMKSAESERKKGTWKPFDLTWGRSVYSCTACGEAMDIPTEMNKPIYSFCPNCGADMRGE